VGGEEEGCKTPREEAVPGGSNSAKPHDRVEPNPLKSIVIDLPKGKQGTRADTQKEKNPKRLGSNEQCKAFRRDKGCKDFEGPVETPEHDVTLLIRRHAGRNKGDTYMVNHRKKCPRGSGLGVRARNSRAELTNPRCGVRNWGGRLSRPAGDKQTPPHRRTVAGVRKH